ncbi:hypothetical protein NEOLEDRAFT_1095874 [Neolentinus lepideus HHB14362 ss-1]|uniref:DUF1917-domain-containing protein n=1 Tax=Neolentinus lepideus HHB14362 ss-1 TaxID=1314782 RepID=A0A165RA04_9AGAM|nr:hypothetical protein NEOLEDRAFT_1095874 [Neolentinus lepideus HHB14362 ss-1]
MVQDDGTKPWIWVKGSDVPKEDGDRGAAINEASEILAEITEKVEKIKNDSSIPTRSNKKTGARSKKELREEVQAEATEKLKAISTKHNFVSGKWLIFAPSDKVDQIWTKLATSLVSGPLAPTQAHLAKVATSPRTDTPNYQHVLCLYMPDVYDEEAVRVVMKILLRNHGLNLSGVKSDLYTAIGIDSKHPSGIPSTVWKNTSLMKDSEIKELKDAFFAELGSSKPSADDKKKDGDEKTLQNDGEKAKDTAPAKEKPKPNLKKKAGQDDFFASDADDEESKPAPAPAPAKGKKPAPKLKSSVKAAKDDPFASEDEAEDEAKKPPVKEKKRAQPKKVPKDDPFASEDEAEGEEKKPPVKERKRAQPKKGTKRVSDDDEDEPPKKKTRRGGR